MKKIALSLTLLPLTITLSACVVERTAYVEPRTTEYHSYAVVPGEAYQYDQTVVDPNGSTEYHHVVQPYTATEYHHVESTSGVIEPPGVYYEEDSDE